MISVINVFKENANYISNPDADEKEGGRLELLDKIITFSFALGILFTSIGAILVATNNLTTTSNIQEGIENGQRRNSISKNYSREQKFCDGQLERRECNTEGVEVTRAEATGTAKTVRKEKIGDIMKDKPSQSHTPSEKEDPMFESWSGANGILKTSSKSNGESASSTNNTESS